MKLILIAICAFFTFNSGANCQTFSFDTESEIITLPAGTLIRAESYKEISSKKNRIGDDVVFIVTSKLSVDKNLAIPKDSLLQGKIVQLERAQQGRDGYFQIIFDRIIFPDGWKSDIMAKIWTKRGTGIIGGNLTKGRDYKKSPHYIENIGPVAQLVKTGPKAMGEEKTLPRGSEFVIVLEKDLHIK